MRMVAYFAILIAVFFAPVERLDVANLEPVEILYVSQRGKTITVATDTGAQGRGESITKALALLRATTPGVVYLDTARYLLFDREAEKQIEQLRSSLRGDIRICLAESVEFEDLAQYLQTHGNLPYLRTWKQGNAVPELRNGKIV